MMADVLWDLKIPIIAIAIQASFIFAKMWHPLQMAKIKYANDPSPAAPRPICRRRVIPGGCGAPLCRGASH
jgi:hypothetical protein